MEGEDKANLKQDQRGRSLTLRALLIHEMSIKKKKLKKTGMYYQRSTTMKFELIIKICRYLLF